MQRFGIIGICLFILGVAQGATVLNQNQQAEMVKTHNRWRQQVGVLPIRWANNLANSAQRWAEHLRRTNGCQMVHSHGSVGENLYWASAVQWTDGRRDLQKVSAKQVANSWGNEKKYYNYARNSCVHGQMCGHYTQMVWKNSTQLGCGMAVCTDKSQVWVCHYSPAGNYVGRKPY
jgi:pathogenesis-related protein 1